MGEHQNPREQELGSTKSRLGKITGKVRSQKREQAPIKGAAGKKLQYEERAYHGT